MNEKQFLNYRNGGLALVMFNLNINIVMLLTLNFDNLMINSFGRNTRHLTLRPK